MVKGWWAWRPFPPLSLGYATGGPAVSACNIITR